MKNQSQGNIVFMNQSDFNPFASTASKGLNAAPN
jgi:hypothetical protein